MATIQKRKSSKTGKLRYTVIVRLMGYPTQTATFDRLADAKEWGIRKEKEIKHFLRSSSNSYFYFQEPVKLPQKHKLTEAINRYIETRLDYDNKYSSKVLTHLAWWNKKLGKCYIEDITHVLLAEYQDKLKSERKISNSTVNRYFTSLSALFTTAVREWGWLKENPVSKVRKKREPNGRVRCLTQPEIQTLLTACKQSINPYLYYIVFIALSTGARHTELVTLQWENIDFERRLIYFLKTKNKEARSVPMSSKVYELLIELKDKHIQSTLLFPGKDKSKPVRIRKAWVNALTRAGIKDFRFHDLRHCCSSYLAMNGATLMELSHILGHKTLQMVKRYAHLTDQHTADLIERMSQKTL